MAANIFSSTVGRFRLISFAEGLSFLFLLGIAMPLKYVWHMPETVRVAGMLHGILFVIYVVFLFMATMDVKWSIKTALLLFLASIFPFGFLLAEYMFLKKQPQNPTA